MIFIPQAIEDLSASDRAKLCVLEESCGQGKSPAQSARPSQRAERLSRRGRREIALDLSRAACEILDDLCLLRVGTGLREGRIAFGGSFE